MNKIEKIMAVGAVLLFAVVLLLVRELKIQSTESQASGPRGSIFHSREDRDVQTFVPLPITPGFPHQPGSTTPSNESPGYTTPPTSGGNATVIPSTNKPVPSYNGGGGFFQDGWLCQYFGFGCDYSSPLPSKYN